MRIATLFGLLVKSVGRDASMLYILLTHREHRSLNSVCIRRQDLTHNQHPTSAIFLAVTPWIWYLQIFTPRYEPASDGRQNSPTSALLYCLPYVRNSVLYNSNVRSCRADDPVPDRKRKSTAMVQGPCVQFILPVCQSRVTSHWNGPHWSHSNSGYLSSSPDRC